MNGKILSLAVLVLASAAGCKMGQDRRTDNMMDGNYEKGSFGYDLGFLKQRDSGLVVLTNDAGNGQILVSPKYQAKVFTSTAGGLEGQSFGWVNYGAFDQKPDPHMNPYGGEDRLWLGPEGGPFSLYFKPGTAMVFENWYTPPAIDTETWDLVSATGKQASMRKDVKLVNYVGTELSIGLHRTVEVLEISDMEQQLDIAVADGVNAVGFRTENVLANTGTAAWTKETGAPCLWNLDMFAPTPHTVIVIPYKEEAEGKVATTDYFGEIPADRIVYRNGLILFKADGKSRGKLGVGPQRALPVAGSYDADNRVLTVMKFDVHPGATYLNQEWTTEKDPFSGDAVNAYNDGPLADGSQMGPFYEIESVSPAAFLGPQETLSHAHSVFHFTGNEAGLERIAEKVFGVSLDDIIQAFEKQD